VIYRPTQEAGDWESLLDNPAKDWKSGFSAKTLAHCWEDVRGLPKSVKDALNRPNGPFNDVQPLLILPEHKVSLPGHNKRSQCDVWVLAKDSRELISITVEGKVSESFGNEDMGQWMKDASKGKIKRIEFILSKLELGHVPEDIPENIRYQLLHRTAAAVIVAERFEAQHAIILVHSFSDSNENFEDFARFLDLYELIAEVNHTKSKELNSGITLHLAWAKGETEFLKK